MSESKLMEYWKFDEADLGANRLGKLTEKQRTKLVDQHTGQKNTFLVVGAVMAFLFLCVPGLVFMTQGLSEGMLDGLPISSLKSFALPVIFGAVILFMFFKRGTKKAELAVLQTSGVANYAWGTKRVRTPGSSVREYEDVKVLHLTVGDKKFEVREELQEMIKEGEGWTLYYTSNPFKFLSAEKNSK